MKQLLSFVIPCYHSEQTLPAVVEDIRATVEADGRYDYEVILVNDNPPDATYRVIRQLAEQDSRVRGLCMIRNFGQHAALMAGYRAAVGDIIVSLDDDGQTPPHYAAGTGTGAYQAPAGSAATLRAAMGLPAKNN